MEVGPGQNFIRPWFWIFALFAGAVARTVLFQNYMFYATRALAHTESLLTQLILEHSLRIRLTSHATEEEKPITASAGGSTIAGTLETASIAESSTGTSGNGNENDGDGTHSQSATAVSTDGTQSTVTKSSSVKGKGMDTSSPASSSAPAPKKDEKKDEKKDKEDNLVGKINNLVTTDLGNIIDSRDFLFLREFTFTELRSG